MTRKGIDDLAAVRKDAADGDGEAQKRLGEVYFFQRDYGQAEAWLKKAASRNVPGAEDLLQRVDAFRSRRRVLMLKHVERAAGLGSPGDLELLHLAAEEDLGEAQQLLSEIYLSGKGVPRDWREAARWLSRAAKHKGSSAEGPLRQHLLQAARRNDPDDSDFLQGAAAEGVGEAQHVLKYIECKKGPQRDHGQAAKSLSLAAKCRGSRTRELLREELRHAADPSSPHGLEFLHGAAQEGVGEAQKLLGKKYLFGKGVRRDFRNAGKWLGRATRRKGSGAGSLLRQCLHRAAQRSGPAELDFLKGAAEEGVAKAKNCSARSTSSGGEFRATLGKPSSGWNLPPHAMSLARRTCCTGPLFGSILPLAPALGEDVRKARQLIATTGIPITESVDGEWGWYFIQVKTRLLNPHSVRRNSSHSPMPRCIAQPATSDPRENCGL